MKCPDSVFTTIICWVESSKAVLNETVMVSTSTIQTCIMYYHLTNKMDGWKHFQFVVFGKLRSAIFQVLWKYFSGNHLGMYPTIEPSVIAINRYMLNR